MKATMKRIVSIVLALAMVVAGMNYTPKAVEAADYSGLTYNAIENNQNSEFSQTLYNSQYAVYEGETPNPILYQNTSFGELYFAYTTMAAPITATANGQSISTEGTGVRMLDAANYLTYEYNVVDVVDTNGKTSTLIIYCPANAGKGTYEDGMEQGSQDPGETESQNYDDLNWIAVNYGGYPQYEGMYDYCILSGTAVTNVDVLQAPDWGAGHVGLYVILVDVPTTILINGVEHTGDTADDGDEVQGAGVLLNVSAFTQYINTIEFTCSNGAVGTLLIRNNSVDPDEGSTTTADQSTTTEAQKEDPDGRAWYGTFEAEGWANYAISDDSKGFALENKNIGSDWYAIQTFSPSYSVVAGTTYYCTFTFTAPYPYKCYSVDLGNDPLIFTETDLGEWTQNADGTWSTTFTGTYVATETKDDAQVRVSFGYHTSDYGSTGDAYHQVTDEGTSYNMNTSYNFTLSGFEFYEISDSETTTTETQAQGSDDDYDWIQVANSDIYWYYTEASDLHGFQWESHGDDWGLGHSGIYIYSSVVALSQIFINGEEHDNDGVYDEISGAGVLINDEALTQHINEIIIIDANGTSHTVLIRNDAVSASDYAPSGLAASVSGSTATIVWSNSSATEEIGDASRVQYVLTVNGTEYRVQSDGSLSVSIDLSDFSYGTYTATLDTYVDGEKVDSQSTSFSYSDPYAVESTVTFTNQLESKRRVRVYWTAVANVTGYAIYVDGSLVDTTDADATQYDLYSYLFSDYTNEAGQPTSTGTHHIAVVALFDNEEAPSSIGDVNSSHIMGEFDDTIYVNYIWGNSTDLWNDTGVDSSWNFTITEAANGTVTAGSSAHITYNDDGSATITPAGDDEYINMGTHTGGDQQWMLKASIYDEYIGVGEWINLSFTITVPGDTWDLDSSASDRTITIKCIAEECDDNGAYLNDNIYDESDYTFEYDEETDTWQIHYSLTVESANDTYDLLFGLGKLKVSEITLSDVIHTTLYGLTSLTPSGVYNLDDPDNSSIYISWTSDIPANLTNEYTFKVYIASYDSSKSDDDQDFVEITLPGNVSTMSGEEVSKLVSGLLYSGYAPGEYVVKAESYYIYDDRTPTSSLTAHTVIENTNQADLIISSMTVTDNEWNSDTEFHIGDTVTVTYTMTNIGTADAVSTNNLMAGWYYFMYDESGNLVGSWVFYDTFNDDTKTLAVGASVTASFTMTITEDMVNSNGFVYIGVWADSDKTVAESNDDNNTYIITLHPFAAESVLELENNGENVVATWPEVSDSDKEQASKMYIEYTDYSTGETVRVELDSLDETSYTFPVDVYLPNESIVSIVLELEDGEIIHYAEGQALADLVMIEISADTDPLYTRDATTITGVVKNIGTGVAETTDVIMIMFHTEDDETSSFNGYYLPTNESTILVNGTSSFTTQSITISTAGEYEINYQVDERNNIKESDKDNNYGSFTITVLEKEYNKMDWTLLTSESGGQGDVYDFSVNGGGYTANIEYKILDTSYVDQDWDTIFTNYSGYNGNWMAMGIDGADNIFTSGETTGTAGVGTTTRTYFSQSDSTFCNYYDDSIDATDFEALLEMGYTLHSYNNMAVYDTDGNVLLNAGGGDSSMVDNGNGFNYFVNSWGVGKYYVMYIVDANGDYIVVAFHVTGDENGWVQAKASDGTDVDNLDVYYHEDDCKTTGSYYYNASDHGLSYIGVYNGGWFSLVLDESAGLQGANSNCAVYLGYASVDEDGNFVTPEIGDYLSYCNDITSLVYNFEGMNTFQFNIDVITKDLPVHSDREVNPDSEYYYMVIYPDLTNNPDYYVAIPIMVRADIPEIEEVDYDAVLAIGGDDENVLSVSLNENSTQSKYDYRYQISVYESEEAYNNGDNAIVESEEYSHNDGSYFEGFTYTIESESVYVVVTTMWCDQVVTNGVMVIAEDDSGWRLISGESNMYVALDGSNIYGTLYWNKDIKGNHAYDITGWNGTYLGITGNSKYYDAMDSGIKVSISKAMPVAASVDDDVNVEDLDYTDAEVIGGSDEQIQVNTEEFISAKYQVTYYVVKVEQGGVTNYIEMCATVATGDVKIAGFQMNTDTSEGAVSEFGPSFRIVSDVARVLPLDSGSDYSDSYANVRYEFEDGTIVGEGYSIEVAPNFSPYEGYHNDLTGNDGGAAIGGLNEWPNNGRKYVSTTVDVDTEGVYMLTICYAEGADLDGESGVAGAEDHCNIDIRVNGSDWASLETEVTTNWETTDTVQTPIVLKAGENVIDVTGASYVWNEDMAEGHNVIEWVNLDYFEIQMTNPQIDTVASYGTIYTVNDDVNSSDMKYKDLADLNPGEPTEVAEGIYAYPATTDVGVTSKWASTDLGSDLQTFALTIKPEAWILDMLDTDFTVRAYAITTSGKIIYSDNSTDSARKVTTTSIYDIAENLYNGNKMGTEDAHEYLYDNVLNQIAIRDNRSAICNSMLKAIGITSTSDSRYNNVNTIYKDMKYFINMEQSYANMKYYERGAFTSQDDENEATVLGWLNTATSTSYSTLSEWIENETESVDQGQYKGYYKKVAYTGSGYNNTVAGDNKE